MQRRESLHEPLQWDDVRLFLTLCRARTLGEAAKALRVDTSTVSRRLTALEERLDASLFDRDRAGVSATESAERLLPVAEEIEHAMARFSGAAESLERTITGLVRIACPPDLAEAWIVPRLPELLACYPDLRIELIAGEDVVDVARRAADLALRTVRPQSGDLLVRTLQSVDWVLAGAPSLVAELGTVSSLGRVPMITCGPSFAHTPSARWLSTHLCGDPLLQSDSIRVQIAAAESGIAIALLPSGSVTHYGLQPLKLSAALRRSMAPFPRDELLLLTHRALRHVPRVDAVWNFLLREAPDPHITKRKRRA